MLKLISIYVQSCCSCFKDPEILWDSAKFLFAQVFIAKFILVWKLQSDRWLEDFFQKLSIRRYLPNSSERNFWSLYKAQNESLGGHVSMLGGLKNNFKTLMDNHGFGPTMLVKEHTQWKWSIWLLIGISLQSKLHCALHQCLHYKMCSLVAPTHASLQ
jgi:hypothetical protein